MSKTHPSDVGQRRDGEAIAKQPYSVDPTASPKIGTAGPKRWQAQPGQALTESEEGQNDGE